MATILIIDDNETVREGVSAVARKLGHEVLTSPSGDEGVRLLGSRELHLVVTDLKMDGLDGMGVLRATLERSPETAVVIMTGFATVETAVEAIKLGAFDFIEKPFSTGRIRAKIEKALEWQALRETNARLAETTKVLSGARDVELVEEDRGFDRLVGQSAAMRDLFGKVKKVAASEANVVQRSRDWSEVRPEWGLAGNAAFIIAPRSRTAGLDLGGRTFMHSYDHARDPEGTVLELIMTAPMIVTSWINLQYYASAVDNRSFGSGNKLIHNVTGQLGVLLGNGGDLMTGLPWQAVSDGQELMHEPLRLAVVIEAPRTAVERVIEKHRMVADLLENGWLTLLVREGDDFFRWTADGEWLAEPPLAWAA